MATDRGCIIRGRLTMKRLTVMATFGLPSAQQRSTNPLAPGATASSPFGGGGSSRRPKPGFGVVFGDQRQQEQQQQQEREGQAGNEPDRGAMIDGGDTGAVIDVWFPDDIRVDFDDVRIEAHQNDPRFQSLIVGTRPPQPGGARLTARTVQQCGLDVTPAYNGVSAPVYAAAQEAYAAVVDALALASSRYDFPAEFTERGCPPDVADNTLLWPLPLLDAPHRPSRAVHATEDGMYDALALVAWSQVRRLLRSYGWRTQLMRDVFADTAAALCQHLYRELHPEAHANVLAAARAVQLRVVELGHCIEACAAQYKGRLGAACGADPRTPLPCDAAYAGAVRLLASAIMTGSAPSPLVRAATWIGAAHAYLTADEEDGAPRPYPQTLSARVPLELLGFAACVGSWCVRFRHMPASLAGCVADRICGGPARLTGTDRDVLRKFAASPLSAPRKCERLAWVAQWC